MIRLDFDRGRLSFHIADGVLVRMTGEELPLAQRMLANRHLQRCCLCRLRFEKFKLAVREVKGYRNAVVRQAGQPSEARRNEFIRQTDTLFDAARAMPFPKQLLAPLQAKATGIRIPILVTAPLMICVGVVLYLLWFAGPATVSASEFLTRAVASDSDVKKKAAHKVACQRLRIRAGGRSFERAVFHGSSDPRVLKNTKRDPNKADLVSALTLVGVNWDEPLSAVSYKGWHDHQKGVTDEIRPSGDGRLTIISSTTGGKVERESLTVRAVGFHPVERAIEFRDARAVDISEVSLEVSNADSIAVDPQPAPEGLSAGSPLRSPLPSGSQLDEAELLARLYLSRLNADMGEQIEFVRDRGSVLVKGLVENDGRKQELNEALRGIRFLTVGINSVSDFKAHERPVPQDNAAQEQTHVARVSLLEQHLVQHGHSRDDLTRISAGLFNSSLAIHQASRNTEQLQLRFSRDQEMTSVAVQARNALLSRNVQRLIENFTEQQRLWMSLRSKSGQEWALLRLKKATPNPWCALPSATQRLQRK